MNRYLKQCIESNMPIIFDYDGVLFEARWYVERINMRNETDGSLLEAQRRGQNLYTTPIPMMQDLVKALKNKIFILSHIHNEVEYSAKCKQVEKYYPSIAKGRILWARSPEDKIRYMEEIKEKYGAFIYIDDTHPALIKFENYFDDSCKFFHVSSLYV